MFNILCSCSEPLCQRQNLSRNTVHMYEDKVRHAGIHKLNIYGADSIRAKINESEGKR